MIPVARRTGIDALGDVPWGTHISHLYNTKADLIEIIVPYFKAGLQSNELCVWVTAEPLGVDEAMKALRKTTRNLDDFISTGQIAILDHSEWYTTAGRFDAEHVLELWVDRVYEAVARGFNGLRVAGNMSWVEQSSWRDIANYEAECEAAVSKYRILAICSFCVDKCTSAQIAEVVQNHRLTLARSGDAWQATESSERRRAEQTLLASEEFNSRLLANSPNPVLVINADAAIEYVNPALERLTGFTSAELLGTGEPYPWWTEETTHKTRRGIKDGMGHNGMTFEDIFRAKSDDQFWVTVTLTPIRWNSELGHLLETWVDITERKSAELISERHRRYLEGIVDDRTRELLAANEELLRQVGKRDQAERKLRQLYEQEKAIRQQLQEEIRRRVEFTRALAHELKTPLTPIVMSSETLAGKLDDEILLRTARNIQKGAINLNTRVDELLDLARGEVDMLKIKREPVDVLALLREVIEEEAPISASRKLVIVKRLPAYLPPIQADRGRLRQIVLNLLNNAFKHTPEGGRITVSAKQEHNNLIIQVSDTGIGIPEGEQERVFNPYHRIDSDRERFSGLGLGLALCRTLVELHGGKIWVKSRPGKGSKFAFSIPI